MARPLLLLLSSLVCALGASQEWAAVRAMPAGRPVEVSYERKHVTGELVSVAADQMVIKTKRGEVTAARVDVKKVWVPAQRRGGGTRAGNDWAAPFQQ